MCFFGAFKRDRLLLHLYLSFVFFHSADAGGGLVGELEDMLRFLGICVSPLPSPHSLNFKSTCKLIRHASFVLQFPPLDPLAYLCSPSPHRVFLSLFSSLPPAPRPPPYIQPAAHYVRFSSPSVPDTYRDRGISISLVEPLIGPSGQSVLAEDVVQRKTFRSHYIKKKKNAPAVRSKISSNLILVCS